MDNISRNNWEVPGNSHYERCLVSDVLHCDKHSESGDSDEFDNEMHEEVNDSDVLKL